MLRELAREERDRGKRVKIGYRKMQIILKHGTCINYVSYKTIILDFAIRPPIPMSKIPYSLLLIISHHHKLLKRFNSTLR
jgi:hypothetical protein